MQELPALAIDGEAQALGGIKQVLDVLRGADAFGRRAEPLNRSLGVELGGRNERDGGDGARCASARSSAFNVYLRVLLSMYSTLAARALQRSTVCGSTSAVRIIFPVSGPIESCS